MELLFLLGHHLLLVLEDLSVVVEENIIHLHVVGFLIPIDHGLVLVFSGIGTH